jgi:hypothetical protein
LPQSKGGELRGRAARQARCWRQWRRGVWPSAGSWCHVWRGASPDKFSVGWRAGHDDDVLGLAVWQSGGSDAKGVVVRQLPRGGATRRARHESTAQHGNRTKQLRQPVFKCEILQNLN